VIFKENSSLLQSLEIDDFALLELFMRRSFCRGRSRLDFVDVDPSSIEGTNRIASWVSLYRLRARSVKPEPHEKDRARTHDGTSSLDECVNFTTSIR
jgi:hypothetical protein